MRLSVLVPAVLFGLSAVACGDSTPNPNDPSQANNQYGGQYGAAGQYGQQGQAGQYGAGQPGQYQAGQYGQQGQPGQYGQPQPGGYPTTGQPQPQPQPQPGVPGGQPAAQGGGSATPIAPAAAAAATPVLTAIAAGEVQGMQPDGGALAGQFQEGQTLESPFNLQAGKCYSVVGAGLGIQELDLQIVAQPFPMVPATVLAQDSSSGPNATLGGKGNCFKNPFPVGGPAKLIVKATRGAGIGVAQIYVK